MKWVSQAKGLIDKFLSGTLMVAFAGMTVLIIVMVMLRYFFNTSIPGGNEALRFAFIYTTFLGASVLIGSRQHIAIHLITKRLPKPAKRILAAVENWIIIAMHVYLLTLSFRWIHVTGGNMAEELKFPIRFVQIALPIGVLLASLYAFGNSIEALFDREWPKEMTE